MPMPVAREYETKLDSKNRMTVRQPRYNHYHVVEFEDGCIELRPRVLFDPNLISKNTLRAMDAAMANLKEGRVSEPINLADLED